MSENEPTYEILIDPPGADWANSTPGLLFILQAWAELLSKIDPWDHDNAEDLMIACRIMIPSLRNTVDELLNRADNHDAVDIVRKALMRRAA